MQVLQANLKQLKLNGDTFMAVLFLKPFFLQFDVSVFTKLLFSFGTEMMATIYN